MKWDYLTLKIWEDKQKKIKNYINEYELKPALYDIIYCSSNSWKRLEMKCLAYYKLCGQYMTNKSLIKRNNYNTAESYDISLFDNDNNVTSKKGIYFK